MSCSTPRRSSGTSSPRSRLIAAFQAAGKSLTLSVPSISWLSISTRSMMWKS
ncbi:MAG: hypothetical protein WDN69_26165 [Aliidongia sp.]